MRYKSKRMARNKRVHTPEHLTNLTAAAQNTGADFINRRVYLIGTIDESVAKHFMVAFNTMDDTPGEITVVLCSSGGEESAGYAIYDMMTAAQNPVTIVAYGECMSIATLVLQGATERYLSPECQLMVHNGHVVMGAGDGEGGVQVDADDMVKYAAEVKRNNSRYHLALSKHTGQPIKLIKAMCERETFMSAKEAVEKGFADGVIHQPKPRKQRKKR